MVECMVCFEDFGKHNLYLFEGILDITIQEGGTCQEPPLIPYRIRIRVYVHYSQEIGYERYIKYDIQCYMVFYIIKVTYG